MMTTTNTAAETITSKTCSCLRGDCGRSPVCSRCRLPKTKIAAGEIGVAAFASIIKAVWS
jgi:hypothetical protein